MQPTLVILALVLIPSGVLRAQRGAAPQQRPPAPPAGGLETIQIRPNVYVIFGAGANITAHLGEDGVILVDSGTDAQLAVRI